MKFDYIASTVIGHSKKMLQHNHNAICQDHHKVIKNKDFLILAVADGHGSEHSPKSDIGSKIAVEVFCDYFESLSKKELVESLDKFYKIIKDDMESRIPIHIINEWKKRIEIENEIKDFNKTSKSSTIKENKLGGIDHKDEKLYPYILYGTTLLGMLITNDFYFAFQLGDGDILEVSDNFSSADKVNIKIIPDSVDDKILGTETYSLAEENPATRVRTDLKKFSNDNQPVLFLISTDGLSNSFKNTSEFKKSGSDYLNLLKTHGRQIIETNINTWLDEISTEGCGDDITLVLAFNEAIEHKNHEEQN